MSMISDFFTRRELAPRVRVKGLRTRRVYMRFPRALDGYVGVGTLKGFEGCRFDIVSKPIPEQGEAKATTHFAVTRQSFDERLGAGTVAVFGSHEEAREALTALAKAMAPSRWRYLGYLIVFLLLLKVFGGSTATVDVALPTAGLYPSPYAAAPSLPPGVTITPSAPVMPSRPPTMTAPAPSAPAVDPFGLNLGGAAK